MKFLPIVCLCTTLWLTGCASTGVITGADSSSRASGTAAPVSSATSEVIGTKQAAVSVSGELLPITATRAASSAVAQLAPPADLWERIRWYTTASSGTAAATTPSCA